MDLTTTYGANGGVMDSFGGATCIFKLSSRAPKGKSVPVQTPG